MADSSVAFHSAREYLHKARAAARNTNKKTVTHSLTHIHNKHIKYIYIYIYAHAFVTIFHLQNRSYI